MGARLTPVSKSGYIIHMRQFSDWTTAWFTASIRTRVVTFLLLFGAINIGMAFVGFEPGRQSEGSRRIMYTLGSMGLVLTFGGLFFAASHIIRTSQSAQERNSKLIRLCKSVTWYAFAGVVDILLPQFCDFPAVHFGMFMVVALGLMHLTATISELLRTQRPM